MKYNDSLKQIYSNSVKCINAINKSLTHPLMKTVLVAYYVHNIVHETMGESKEINLDPT